VPLISWKVDSYVAFAVVANYPAASMIDGFMEPIRIVFDLLMAENTQP
jgi:hypothetical protein